MLRVNRESLPLYRYNERREPNRCPSDAANILGPTPKEIASMHRQYSRIPLAERFWPKVNRHGSIPPHAPELGPCWLWIAAPNKQGYGQIFCSWDSGTSRPLTAHRASYLLNVGPIPPELWVLHRCDVRLCVRPSHLYLGTNSDNMRDCAARGRLNSQQRSHRKIAGYP
jgi:hypothetical protein